MALPYEGDSLNGKNGAYSLTERGEEVRAIAVRQRTSVSQGPNDYEFENEEPKGCCASFFMRICPECLTRIPSVFLIVLSILIVLFIICSVPLVFVYTYSSSAALQDNPTVLNGRDPNDVWPENNEYEEFDWRSDNGSSTKMLPSLRDLLPKNVTLCRGFGFVCVNRPDIKISTNAVCDGFADCPDGSDEASCTECQTSFSCQKKDKSSTNGTSKLLCLRSNALCDGQKHCDDESDEMLCKGKCASDHFKCSSSSMCLPNSFVCDGEKHCPNGEDEEKCNEKCSKNSKWCKSLQQCLPKWKLCDGIRDCDDGSDEAECDCKQCSGKNKMLCKSSTTMAKSGEEEKGFCVSKHRICNGAFDCPNGEDEDGCPGAMEMLNENDMVKCNDGKMYSKVYACLGLIPSCQGVCDECNKNSAFDCGNKNCILKSKVCNGINDCPNGEDEKNCTCPSTSFKCSSKLPNGNEKCIEQFQRCDGFIDCPEGEDEKECEKCSNDDVFKCSNEKKCIAQTGRCDGRKDCSDGSDEEECTAEKCAVHPFSMYLCSDGKSCFRKNEVCTPYSQCPNPTSNDKTFCAVFQKFMSML